MPGQVLVHGVGGGDHHCQRGRQFSAGASCLLQCSRDAARVSNQHSGIHSANIDAQFEGIGSHHGFHLPAAQAVLNGAAFPGKITAAIAAQTLWIGVWITLPQVSEQQLDNAPRPPKNNGLDVFIDQFSCQRGAFHQRTLADAQLLVDEGRVIDQKMAFAVG